MVSWCLYEMNYSEKANTFEGSVDRRKKMNAMKIQVLTISVQIFWILTWACCVISPLK